MMVYAGIRHFKSNRLDFLSLCFFLTMAHGRVSSGAVRLKNRHMFVGVDVLSRSSCWKSVCVLLSESEFILILCHPAACCVGGLKRGDSQRYFVFNKCVSVSLCVSVCFNPWGRCYWCHLNVYWSVVINGRSAICNSVPGVFFTFAKINTADFLQPHFSLSSLRLICPAVSPRCASEL